MAILMDKWREHCRYVYREYAAGRRALGYGERFQLVGDRVYPTPAELARVEKSGIDAGNKPQQSRR